MVNRNTVRPSACVAIALAVALAGGWAQGGLLGIDWDTGDLYQVSTTDASLTLVGNTGLSNPGGLEFRQSDGTLFALSVFMGAGTPTLYTINPGTAAATAVGPLGIGSTFEGSLAIDPNGRAFGTNWGNDQNCLLFTVNLSTGGATLVGPIGNGNHDIDGLTWRSDGQLVGLDRVTNALLTIDPTTAATTTLATLTPTVGSVGGFAYDGLNYYYSTACSSGSNSLYSVNINTGASTLIGSFSPTISGSDTGISGLAATPGDEPIIPEPATLSLLALGGLLALRRKRKR